MGSLCGLTEFYRELLDSILRWDGKWNRYFNYSSTCPRTFTGDAIDQ
jgi:hypothetical protein